MHKHTQEHSNLENAHKGYEKKTNRINSQKNATAEQYRDWLRNGVRAEIDRVVMQSKLEEWQRDPERMQHAGRAIERVAGELEEERPPTTPHRRFGVAEMSDSVIEEFDPERN